MYDLFSASSEVMESCRTRFFTALSIHGHHPPFYGERLQFILPRALLLLVSFMIKH